MVVGSESLYLLKQVTPSSGFNHLKTAAGIGDILAKTTLPETSDITRFKEYAFN